MGRDNKKAGVGKCTLPDHRVIGINNYNFIITQDIKPFRVNIRYFTDDRTLYNLDVIDVDKLSWEIDGYY
jgi:hypothetical protein